MSHFDYEPRTMKDVESNVSETVYISLGFDAGSPSLIIIIAFILSCGALFNIYTGYALIYTPISSKLTKLLLYNQVTVDCLFCIMVIVTIVTNNFKPRSPQEPIKSLVCYILQSGYLIQVIRLMIVLNVVCFSADRFWAIMYRKTYRLHANLYITICYTIVPIYSLLCAMGSFAGVVSSKGSCLNQITWADWFILKTINGLLRYAVPMFALVVLNMLIIRKLYRLEIISFEKCRIRFHTRITVSNDQLLSSDVINTVTLVHRDIFLNVIGLTIESTIFETLAIVITCLYEWNRESWGIGSYAHLFGLFFLGVSSGLHPFLEIFSVKELKITVSNHYRSLCFS
ncbi:unnamed protein product [Echinostoma caproni]|uniref:G_PROTEIN_RECEP_F1_2 domain-containing protein n=1 Tax=Echinostoma caproni TaxID=27848 RepID=A0A183AYK6_9TREM|nr:unnamed protein product [Echinostoma caproni]